ncbi:glycosyltransferase family 2 protein [Clostridium gasigenes]|uniref:Glycosyltransferase involved in cell wall bisynthesis n=1 Tax=Clostridium gasigenes TaxID=94869 RepID=A0A1H0PP96_9CLOT|nr:glycosyltransferase family 2 protein [Clostridium gasigenes]SDP06630.1 Glycosyltransferase involved in cell wall bisynthesis [Clostridium gasigenes]
MNLFSIITVCYNSEKTIEKTIQSIINQRNGNYEYIIIDGKSTDSTLEIVNKYKKKMGNKLIVISEKDNGIYDAMNKGIRLAKGEFIGFLNSDDFYEDNALNIVENKIQETDEYIYGNTNLIYAFDKKIIEKMSCSVNLLNEKTLRTGMGFSHQSCFVKKNVFDRIGNFNIKYKVGADWDFTIRCYKNNIKFRKLDVIISNFSKDGISAKPHILERHKIRKSNKLYKIIDITFITDISNPATAIQNIFGQSVFMKIREIYHSYIKRR